MQNFEIPGWIWLNLAVLVAAAGFVAFKLSARKNPAPPKTPLARTRATPDLAS
jgi:hypothetical protein